MRPDRVDIGSLPTPNFQLAPSTLVAVAPAHKPTEAFRVPLGVLREWIEEDLDPGVGEVGPAGPAGAPGVAGAPGAAATIEIIEDLTGATGTSHVLANTPSATPTVYLRGAPLVLIASGTPSTTECLIAGSTITTGRVVVATDDFVVRYSTAFVGLITEVLTGTTGTTHTLAQTPSGAVIPLLRGAKLWKKASGPLSPTEYTIAGNTITTGRVVLATDPFVVLYRI